MVLSPLLPFLSETGTTDAGHDGYSIRVSLGQMWPNNENANELTRRIGFNRKQVQDERAP
jgi:hypothetical protein